MKIFSWNVNGIRAAERKGAFDEMIKQDADILCLQETKAERDQLSDDVVAPAGYFSHFFSSSERKGHSGSALYSKIEPDRVVDGLPSGLDTQGRTITAFFGDIAVVNCYFPNGASKTSPLEYKLKFYKEFLEYIDKLQQNYTVVATGDFNVAHTEIDLARPKENKKSIGFLPEERAWIDELIEHNWVDVWREKNPEQTDVYTYWDQKSRARDRNVGWRIDYFFVTRETYARVNSIEILGDWQGSDHVPVVMGVDL